MSGEDEALKRRPMVVCQGCRRHIASDEADCPFCRAPNVGPAPVAEIPDYLPPPAYGMPPIPGEERSSLAKVIVVALMIVAVSILLTLRFAL